MRHYNTSPPWRGDSEHYGTWRWETEVTWFGTEAYWQWCPPARKGGLMAMSSILRDFYATPLQAFVKREDAFTNLLLAELDRPKPMTAEQSKARRKPRWKRVLGL